MQLDFIQLISKLEKLCSLRPIPHREYVEAYVKAYYQPEDDLESWIKDHSVFFLYSFYLLNLFFYLDRKIFFFVI